MEMMSCNNLRASERKKKGREEAQGWCIDVTYVDLHECINRARRHISNTYITHKYIISDTLGNRNGICNMTCRTLHSLCATGVVQNRGQGTSSDNRTHCSRYLIFKLPLQLRPVACHVTHVKCSSCGRCDRNTNVGATGESRCRTRRITALIHPNSHNFEILDGDGDEQSSPHSHSPLFFGIHRLTSKLSP